MADTNPPNPNGANQYQLDPRQKMCWESYINPKSDTFGNATRSAIKAGYEPDYADQITTVEWFKGKVRRLNMLSKAEKVLDDTLTMEDEEDVLIANVPSGIKKRNPALTKIKQDTAKFIAEKLGKDEGYASRSEITGKHGEAIEVKAITGMKIISQTNGDRVQNQEQQTA
jgi:phage terminase small subunit